jgi:2',3'-cyclic-nucleotide 2'-phosphodiesterase (5'-nucleotidase family)
MKHSAETIMSIRLLHFSDIENAYDDPDQIGRLAGCIRHLRDESTLVFGTGDNTAPGVLSLVSNGRQALDFYEAVQPDCETPGNHDFDHGPGAIREIIRESPQEWVCANLFTDTDLFAKEAGMTATRVFERNGQKIGVFGLIDPETPEMSRGARSLSISDPFIAAEKAIETLRRQNAEHIVLLSHLGRLDDQFAREYDIDVILGGHTHDQRIDTIAGTLLTRPGANGKTLLEIQLGDSLTVNRHEVSRSSIDREVAMKLRKRKESAALHSVVGTTSDPIYCDRVVRFEECRVGNLITDAFRWGRETDIGFHNSGGIRVCPPLVGEITVGDLMGVIPFADRLCVAELNGDELKQLVVQAADPDNGTKGWYGHFSGVRARYDRENHTLTELTVNGSPVQNDAAYTLATSEFVLRTAHRFPILTDEHCVARDSRKIYEVVTEYVSENEPQVNIEGRFGDVQQQV